MNLDVVLSNTLPTNSITFQPIIQNQSTTSLFTCYLQLTKIKNINSILIILNFFRLFNLLMKKDHSPLTNTSLNSITKHNKPNYPYQFPIHTNHTLQQKSKFALQFPTQSSKEKHITKPTQNPSKQFNINYTLRKTIHHSPLRTTDKSSKDKYSKKDNKQIHLKQKGVANLQHIHHLLHKTTEKYQMRNSTPKSLTDRQNNSRLMGNKDYELMRRRDKLDFHTLRDSFITSCSKQKSSFKHLQPSKSTFNILQMNSQRNNEKDISRIHHEVVNRYAHPKITKSRQKSYSNKQQQATKFSKTFLFDQQFSISTNFTFQGRHLQIGDFIILGEIQGGRTARVYKCLHRQTSTIYALKIIHKATIKNLEKHRFINQIKINLYIKHPNIVSTYGYFSDKQHFYIIMEYCSGGSLYDLIKGPQLSSEKTVAGWVKDITKALVYLHDLKIVHRDIKPENIVLSFGVAKICDFGCATVCKSRLFTNIGTFDYLAPQILKNEDYDENVDIWGLGVITYQLLTGKAPFYHSSKQTTVQKILKQQILLPQFVSQQAQSFVNMLLIREAKQRCSARVMLHHSFISKNCHQIYSFA